MLDVVFDEDANRTRKDNAPENLATGGSRINVAKRDCQGERSTIPVFSTLVRERYPSTITI
jgi:hypothetical protein